VIILDRGLECGERGCSSVKVIGDCCGVEDAVEGMKWTFLGIHGSYIEYR
jgi:hypothetical protein